MITELILLGSVEVHRGGSTWESRDQDLIVVIGDTRKCTSELFTISRGDSKDSISLDLRPSLPEKKVSKGTVPKKFGRGRLFLLTLLGGYL